MRNLGFHVLSFGTQLSSNFPSKNQQSARQPKQLHLFCVPLQQDLHLPQVDRVGEETLQADRQVTLVVEELGSEIVLLLFTPASHVKDLSREIVFHLQILVHSHTLALRLVHEPDH